MRTAVNDTDSADVAIDPTDKWRRDHERRAARAAVDPHYFDMMPRGVKLRANMIRAELPA